jgi:thioredoxin 1
MAMNERDEAVEPSRRQIECLPGSTVVEFGTSWCRHCKALQGPLAAALQSRPEVRHLKIEDGPGCPLGRSFMVTLWPTLIFLRDGREVTRLVRPEGSGAIEQALRRQDHAEAPN